MKIQDILEANDLSRNTQSTSLNRALKQAYAQFPSAKNDTEAFAAWAMAKQDNADTLIGKQAELTRRQDAVIKTIDKDNIDQEKKLQALDQENDQMADELDQVEKRLEMNPRREAPVPPADEPAKDKATPADAKVAPVSAAPTAPAKIDAPKKPSLPAIGTNQPSGAQAFTSMTPQLTAAGNPQKSLFPSDYGQDSANWARSKLKQNAQDITFRDVYSPNDLRTLAQQELEPTAENKQQPEPPEADYGDDYQRMVARVKKLAGLGPLKTVYDPQRRVYRNVPPKK